MINGLDTKCQKIQNDYCRNKNNLMSINKIINKIDYSFHLISFLSHPLDQTSNSVKLMEKPIV